MTPAVAWADLGIRFREPRTFDRHGLPAGGIRFFPDGERIAVGTYVGRLEIWDARTATRCATIAAPEGFTYGGRWAIGPSGDWFLLAGRDASLRIVDTAGRDLYRVDLTAGAARYLGATLVEPPRGGTGFKYGRVSSLALSPNGTAAVVACRAAYALVWDLASGTLRSCLGPETPREPPVRIDQAGWSPDGRTLFTRDTTGHIRLWDAARGVERLAIQTHDNDLRPDFHEQQAGWPLFGAVAFTPDGTGLAVGDGSCVRILDVDSGREQAQWHAHTAEQPIIGELPVPPIHELHFSANGDRLLTVGRDAKLRLWHPGSGTELWWAIPDPCCVDFADLAPDGGHVAWAACPGMRVYRVY